MCLGGWGGVVACCTHAVVWRRRFAAVRRTGWHHGSARVTRASRSTTIEVDYDAGGRGTLRRVSAGRLPGAEKAEVWIGGTSSAMVVLSPREEGKRPYVAAMRKASAWVPTPAPKSPGKARQRKKRAAAAFAASLPVVAVAARFFRRRTSARPRRRRP
ncbi:hypothetical protein [Amycolatopsis rhizosphaerae]|uniref:hypothetical protein n=1 Tax=Amycolatopsis rhizosphaerae TaxID=2053003 RepID=UPI001643C901|nr:hypothetical protein [Amycolatopsis rhizosphaerae]